MAKLFKLQVEHHDFGTPGHYASVTVVDSETEEEVAEVQFSGQLWEMMFHPHAPVGQMRPTEEAPGPSEDAPKPRLYLPREDGG